MKRNLENAETLIKVENLCQYFKMGRRRKLKAVDKVNFDIRKGEVFGLVGESGCGKTTTGRTIIKLYDATAGNVWFKGTRIVAGLGEYKANIKAKKAEFQDAAVKLDEEANEAIAKVMTENISDAEKKAHSQRLKLEYKEKLAALSRETDEYIATQRAEIKKAKHDHNHCDHDYSKKVVREVEAKYIPLINELTTKVNEGSADSEKLLELKKEYNNELHKAKHAKLVTQIQMIFQDPIASLDPRMTVRDIIAEGLKIHGERHKDVIDEKVFEMLELVGLVREHAGRYPHEFSGGQRQRIGVARSIIMKPDMIIADEPVSALDVSIQAQVINLLNDLREKMGLTIMFIAHDLSVVKYFSDRIGVMYFGTMVELASSDDLFAHPLHPYTKSLLSAIPIPDPQYEKMRKRITYNPLISHDYSVDKPSMREVSPNHFVYCNDVEFAQYQIEVRK